MPKEPEECLISEIVKSVEDLLGVRFLRSDVYETVRHTLRKLETIHKGDDYFRILFENELRDLQMRDDINRGYGVCKTAPQV